MNYTKNFELAGNELKIKDLNLYWRVGKKKIFSKIPSRLNFSIYFDKEHGFLRQDVSPKLNQALNQIYIENENIGYLREDNTLAKGYHEDFLEFILENISDIYLKNVLEIGCGGCTILNALKENNVKVTGLDPSPFALECARKFNIKIINKFFDKELIDQKFDLTFFSDVLEHIERPIQFLKDLTSCLEPKSKIIIAVPDTTTEQLYGDISMCMHQHINYFTARSLKNVFHESGLKTLKIIKSGYGGSLYGLVEVPNKIERELYRKSDSIIPLNKEFNFFKKVKLVIRKFKNIFDKAIHKKILFHCYCPLRALPYLAAIGEMDNKIIRFIDDTPYWNNSFFDGSEVIINSLNDSEISNDDFIFIFSNTFEDKIKRKLLNKGFNEKNIFSLSNLFDIEYT